MRPLRFTSTIALALASCGGGQSTPQQNAAQQQSTADAMDGENLEAMADNMTAVDGAMGSDAMMENAADAVDPSTGATGPEPDPDGACVGAGCQPPARPKR